MKTITLALALMLITAAPLSAHAMCAAGSKGCSDVIITKKLPKPISTNKLPRP